MLWFQVNLVVVSGASVRSEAGSESVAAHRAEISASGLASEHAEFAAKLGVTESAVAKAFELQRQHSLITNKAGVGNAPPPQYFHKLGNNQPLFAYVLKYLMGKQWGVEIVHTSMVFCPYSVTRRDHLDAKKAECHNKWFGSCWTPNKMYERRETNRGPQVVNTNLIDSSCTELGFFAEADPLQPAGIQIYTNSPFSYAGDSDPDVFAVGVVLGRNLDAAIERTMACEDNNLGKRMDFNAYTYDFIGHNCHHHTDAMLNQLSLPEWERPGSRHLPADFMPEDGSKNMILAAVVHKVVGGPVKKVSRRCKEYERQRDLQRQADCSLGGLCGGSRPGH